MRVQVFLDISNLFYCTGKKFNGRKIDYAKYLEYVTGFGTIEKSVAYGAQLGKEAKSFINSLKMLGFETKYKEPRVFRNKAAGTTKIRRKADWDVGITLDVVNSVEAKRVDLVILGTADGDLAPLITWCKSRGVDVLVLACGISRELKAVATRYVEIPESFLEAISVNKITNSNSVKNESGDKGKSDKNSEKIRESGNKSGNNK